jgi:hypothetical protein
MSNVVEISAQSDRRFVVAHPGTLVESVSLGDALARGKVFAVDRSVVIYEIREVGCIDPPAPPFGMLP